MGLVGSEHYVADPLVLLKQTVAMLNLDMVGRLRKEHLIVSGTGTAAEFSPLIDRLGKKYGFRVTQESGGYGPSDHASFFQRGVPVMHFFTGLHADYHRPSDDSERVNVPGMRRIANMFADAVVELSQAERRPQLRRTVESDFLAATDGDTDTAMAAAAVVAGNRGYAIPMLGIEQGAKHLSAGYVVSRIEPGGPAEAAGLRAGDVILSVGNQKVNSADDVNSIIGQSQTGDPLAVHVLRATTELEVDVRPYSR
jgi:hypothetical protein